MDVSGILASHAEKYQSIQVDTESPLEVDVGFLTVTDPSPIDAESYNADLESHLIMLARTSVQSLFASLFTLPTTSTDSGPHAKLPPPTTPLPRAKPLPKLKPLTKWEQFANAKGIQHKKRDKRIWDEEKQDWVNRWGRDGKNREKEDAWITEVPMNADVDHDPRKVARDERKARVAKNEKQRQANVSRASSSNSNPREERKKDIDRTLSTARISTASMGRFDTKLEGEKKMRGIKRKFDPAEASVDSEKNASLALLSKMDSDSKKMRLSSTTRSKEASKAEEGSLNVRKAVRFASKGRGSVALGRERSGAMGGKRGGRGRGGKRT